MTLLGRASLTCLALILISCTGSRRTGPRGDAAVMTDSAVMSDTSADTRADTTVTTDGGGACLAGVTPVDVSLTIMIEDTCAIWNSLDLLGGMATITRAGDSLTIDFGDGIVFTGTIIDGVISLTYVHPHEFTDGCGWEARETLTGSVNPDCSLSLAYDYVESVAIDRGLCATPCSAEADVSLELMPLI